MQKLRQKFGVSLQMRFESFCSSPLLFPPLLSYSMILVEIATRSYLSAVSVLAGFQYYNLQSSLGLCLFKPAVPLKQDHGDGMRMDIMWRPPLPEITAGKADTDCPSQGDYCEVRPVCRCQRGLFGRTWELQNSHVISHGVSPVKHLKP